MKHSIAGPVALTMFGLACLWMLNPLTHSPLAVVKFGALILPLLLTLSGMSWLISRLRT